jgi:UPF0755 protein
MARQITYKRAYMNVYQVAKNLAEDAKPITVKVVFPEGKRLKDLPEIFAKAGFNTEDIKKALQDVKLSKYAKESLEGFLFPATYVFRPDASADEMIKAMGLRMEQELTKEKIAKAKRLGLTIYEWLTLASMVQAEAADNTQMPIIAGVFLNRLSNNLALGSDPTVAYGLGKNLPELDRAAGDFLRKTPYNTYTKKGLPKGPIGNPGHAAIMSVLFPDRKLPDGQEALYFLHGLDRKIHVNHSYNDHLRDIKLFR